MTATAKSNKPSWLCTKIYCNPESSFAAWTISLLFGVVVGNDLVESVGNGVGMMSDKMFNLRKRKPASLGYFVLLDI